MIKGFTLMTKRREGFTLIEVLVVFGISALLVGVVVANQRDFSRKRVSENAALLLQADIRQAQEKSLAGVKPEDAVCQGVNTLDGYEVRFTSTGYETVAICTGGEVVTESQEWSDGVTPTILSSDTSILFRTVGQGTDRTSDLPLNLCAFDSAETVTISPSGEVILDDAPCATPYVATATPAATATPVPTATPTPGDGLYGQYYEESNLTGLDDGFTRVDPTVDFNWSGVSNLQHNGAGVGTTFSVRWVGWVRATTTGSYTFSTVSDDGVRLWVNGTQIINNWTNHSATTNNGTIVLQAGQLYPLQLEYYQNGGDSQIRLRWQPPSSSTLTTVPQSNLYTTDASAGAWTFCANEGGTCSFSGTKQVRYGANGSYAYRTATGSIGCNNSVFGDPIVGTKKQCHYR